MRAKLGEETTAFERITDGARTVAAGDVVRVNAKPQVVGRVLHFTIPQVHLLLGVGQAGGWAGECLCLQLLARLHRRPVECRIMQLCGMLFSYHRFSLGLICAELRFCLPSCPPP